MFIPRELTAGTGWPAVLHFGVAKSLPAPNILSTVAFGARNLESFNVAGTYDTATRRVVGTFEAKWGPTTRTGVAEGEISDSFDVTIPDV